MAGPCFPKHGLVVFMVLKNDFVWMLCSYVKTLNFMAGPRSRTSPVTAQLILRRWKIISFWCCADFQQRSNEQLVGLPETRSRAFHGFKKPLIWMVGSFSKTFEFMAGPCSPKHGPVPFTVSKDFFVWVLCTQLNTIKLMAGPRSPTSPVMVQLILRRWRIISFWCCADFQQRLNERLIVLPKTRSRALHGVEEFFRLDGMKFLSLWLGRAPPNTAQFLSRC